MSRFITAVAILALLSVPSLTRAQASARITTPGGAAASLEQMPRSFAPQDPADSLWRAARTALNRNDYRRAADLYRQIADRHPRSAYAADSHYWEAFALSRVNSRDELNRARTRLVRLQRDFPRSTHIRDAGELMVRIDGQLARLGDAEAAARVTAVANPAPAPRPNPAAAPRPRTPATANCPDDDGMRMTALNALLQMESSQAVPILREVMANRSECNAPLRRQAVFLISQKNAAEVEDVLVDAVRNDPDARVREHAVFWLSQVPSERAVDAILQLLRTTNDPKVQERAVFALSQHRSPRAGEALRSIAERSDAPREARKHAIFWLAQHHAAAHGTYLRQLYAQLDDAKLKEAVLFGLAQRRGEGHEQWLVSIAMNEREPLEVRKQALFWVGQHGDVPARDLVALYDRFQDRQLRQHLMFVYSQRNEPEVLDKMMDIARRDPDPEVRKQAIFWLGQSKDPRAARFLLEIIGSR